MLGRWWIAILGQYSFLENLVNFGHVNTDQ